MRPRVAQQYLCKDLFFSLEQGTQVFRRQFSQPLPSNLLTSALLFFFAIFLFRYAATPIFRLRASLAARAGVVAAAAAVILPLGLRRTPPRLQA